MTSETVPKENRREPVGLLAIILTAVLTAGSTGIVSQYFWYDQQSAQSRAKRFDVQMTYLERTNSQLSAFRSISFLFFSDYLSAVQGHDTPQYEAKHSAFHNAEKELKTSLMAATFFFGPEVRDAIHALQVYQQSVQWEQIIQSDETASRARSVDGTGNESGDSTDLIIQLIQLDEYDRLSHNVISAMSNEISRQIPTK